MIKKKKGWAPGNARVRVFSFKSGSSKTSLVVQWLKLLASTAGNTDLIPSWETKIPHASRCSQKKIQQKRKISLSRHPAGDELQEYRRGERGKQQSQKISSVSFALPRPASPVLIVGPPATILITDSSPKVW